jgi:hypothetical protein
MEKPVEKPLSGQFNDIYLMYLFTHSKRFPQVFPGLFPHFSMEEMLFHEFVLQM